MQQEQSMLRILTIFVVFVLMSGGAWAQEKQQDLKNENLVSEEVEKTKSFHFELFTVAIFNTPVGASLLTNIGGPLLNRTVAEGSSRFSWTFPIDFYFVRGNKAWKRCNDFTDTSCNEVVLVPNWIFSGFGFALVSGRDNGLLQLRLPVLGRRVVKNFWLTTGVGIMPFAKENHFGLTVGIQSWVAPPR